MNLRDFFTLTHWWGKILGACFGYLSAGPLGALLGILIGNFFDKGLGLHFSEPYQTYRTLQNPGAQNIFFETTFSIMGCIAKADGRISKQEIALAQQVMQDLRLSAEQKKRARQAYQAGKLPTFTVKTALLPFLRAFREDNEVLRVFIDIQYRAAQVDGLTPQKIQLLDIIFTALGFSPLNQQHRFYQDFSYTSYQHHQQYQQQQNHYSSQTQPQSHHLNQAYAVLEVSAQASQQEVKKAYRRLLSKNHPDKLGAQGLNEAQIKRANEKTHTIMRAYELICKNKGW